MWRGGLHLGPGLTWVAIADHRLGAYLLVTILDLSPGDRTQEREVSNPTKAFDETKPIVAKKKMSISSYINNLEA